MKFTLLDSRVAHSNQHEQHDHHEDKTYTDKYQYLDDLLDKTYLIDYFLVHDADNPSVSNSATTNK